MKYAKAIPGKYAISFKTYLKYMIKTKFDLTRPKVK
jgi:hypothetical protein